MVIRMDDIVVVKYNQEGVETWRYTGRILTRSGNVVTLEALFNREEIPFHGILLKPNDRFIETYYSDRWYNIFEIHDRDSGEIKGWYCNVTRPAEFSDGFVAYVDLALDLLVYPDGHWLELDRDEFNELSLDEPSREKAEAALRQLQELTIMLTGKTGPDQTVPAE
jgi:protein associated with RNAse G/E